MKDIDEDAPATSPIIKAEKLKAIPEVLPSIDLKEIQKADLLHHQVLLHNLNEAWSAAYTVKDVALLSMTTLKVLEARRQMLLLPTKVEKETGKSGYWEAV